MFAYHYFNRRILGCIVLVVTGLGIFPVGSAWAADEPAAVATGANDQAEAGVAGEADVTEIKGKHVQASADGGKTWKAIKKGDKLGVDALVRTGFGCECKLKFGDHSILDIKALSSVRLADYKKAETSEKVRPHLQYGAVRCGVEKGRIKADAKISTPVSTLSIRGTVVYVEYDPGTLRCRLRVDEHGPAVAGRIPLGTFTLNEAVDGTGGQQYVLQEGTGTNENLGRDLESQIMDRTVWVTGSYEVGGVSELEAGILAFEATGGVIEAIGGGATQTPQGDGSGGDDDSGTLPGGGPGYDPGSDPDDEPCLCAACC